MGHLGGHAYKFTTQFSSSAASLPVASSYVYEPTAYISVIGTRILPGKNFVAHVPALGFLSPNMPYYSEEYLVHGIIQGLHYKAISVQAFMSIGFHSLESR